MTRMRCCLGLLAVGAMLTAGQGQGQDICAADISGPARGVPDGTVNVIDVRSCQTFRARPRWRARTAGARMADTGSASQVSRLDDA